MPLFWNQSSLSEDQFSAVRTRWAWCALIELVTIHIADAPDSASPIDAANTGLQERELIKLASLTVVMAEVLGRRGIGEPAAKLTAETGVAVFKVAFDRWISATNNTDLAQVVGESLDGLRVLTAST
jgi:hypothetical protein